MIIFISYDSINYNSARTLAVQLGILGHDVKFERKGIGGRVKWDQVFESIEACDVFFFCLTRRSFLLYAQRVEYDYACALDKPIVCVQLENVDGITLPAELSVMPPIAYQDRKAAFPALAEACECILPSQFSSDTLPARPSLLPTLDKLRVKAIRLPKSSQDQYVLYYNVKQFLERRETFRDAKDILEQIQLHPRADKRIVKEIDLTFEQIAILRAEQITSQWRTQIFRVMVALIVVPIILFAMVKGIEFLPSVFKSADAAPVNVSLLETSAQDAEIEAPDAIQKPNLQNALDVESANVVLEKMPTHVLTDGSGED